MKFILVFWGLVAFVSGQVVVPEKGWERVQEGDGKTEGAKFLGVWENEEKTITLGVAWIPELPDLNTLLGFGPEDQGIDPEDWPKDAELLAEGKLGVKVDFGFVDLKGEERKERYWLYGEKGGLLLRVFSKKGTDFSLEDWNAEGVPVDADGVKWKEMQSVVTWVKTGAIRSTIKIDPSQPSEEVAKTLKRIGVVVREGGVYQVEGKAVKAEALEDALKTLATELKKNDEDLEIQVVLDVTAEKGAGFQSVKILIETSAKVGINYSGYFEFEDEGKREASLAEQAIKEQGEIEKIVAVIKADGTFWFGDKEMTLEKLGEAFKAEVIKIKKEDAITEPVLHVRAAKEVEFKYVQRVIKAGAKAGIKQVAYASFAKEE